MSTIDFRSEAQAMRDELVARRRDLHRHPELAFEEVRTASIIAEELGQLGLEVQTGVGKTGVVGVLEGEHDGPTVLYRADMDALPILEENEVDYVSTTPGKMHACGHDGHVTIALGVAKLLAAHRDRLAGRVKFVFQPAEETAGGAQAMIADGVMHQPTPDVVLGMHLWNPVPLGTVGVAEGAIMSGASVFQIIVHGQGGHAALPSTAIDPVTCAAQLITALHTMVGRKVDMMAGAVVLSVTSVETSSKAYNVIPEDVEIRGTFRTMNADTSRQLEDHIRAISEAVCGSMGCTVDVNVNHQTIPVVNDSRVTAQMRQLFAGMVGEANLDAQVRTMAAEDVAYMLDAVPGMYVLVGASNAARGLTYDHHHPRFDFDEDVLPLSVGLMSAAVAHYVMPDAQ
ncbi:MAG: peptidase M20 [Anaerolineaceae bacterium]|nr:peptidase M20 [Anaerolineaceae bacterium]